MTTPTMIMITMMIAKEERKRGKDSEKKVRREKTWKVLRGFVKSELLKVRDNENKTTKRRIRGED